MYHFAIIALLALGTLKLVDFLTDQVSALKGMRGLLTFVVAIGSVLLLDYSIFSGFGIDVRNETTGMWITGFCVAGLTVPWRALFAWFTHDKAARDETLGEPTRIARAA